MNATTRDQVDTLVDRELALWRGNAGPLLMLLMQAPLIGTFVGLAWRNEEPGPPALFMMAVAAIWMGCLNACCAIVRERVIFERERMFQLSIRAYLQSKISVLSMLAAVQVILLLMAESRGLRFSGGWAVHLGTFVVLTLTAVSATALGLAISAWARTAYGAVVSVPVFLIPQIVFSELLLKGNIEKPLPDLIENFTLTKWSYEALRTMADGRWDWAVLAGSMAALLAATALLLGLGAVFLRYSDSDML